MSYGAAEGEFIFYVGTISFYLFCCKECILSIFGSEFYMFCITLSLLSSLICAIILLYFLEGEKVRVWRFYNCVGLGWLALDRIGVGNLDDVGTTLFSSS